MSDKPEVVLNLWYLTDDSHYVISLKAMAYVCIGSDEEKLKFLHSRARYDYLIAEDFAVPTSFTTHFPQGIRNTIDYRILQDTGREVDLFESCIAKLEGQFSKISAMKIPDNPLVCITPILLDDDLQLKFISDLKNSSI